MAKDFKFYWEKPREMKIDMPGFKKDEIAAKIEGGMLIVSASRKEHKQRKAKGFYSEESSSSSISRSVSLPRGANASDIEIDIRDGEVVLKKKKKARV